MQRVRSLGANIMVDGRKLAIVHRHRLPAELHALIREHAVALAAFLEGEAAFEERAAIIEYDGGLTREGAEYLTRMLMASPPAGVDRADWTFFVTKAAEAIDRDHFGRVA
jgi:hypothetical protein